MQYSLDSTNGTDGTWTNALATNTSVTFVAGDVYVRQTALPTNFHEVATIVAVATAPTSIGINVAAGQITGTTATQQYSVDGGTTWNDATATNTAVTFAGGNAIVVREKATASALASDSTTPILVQAAATAPTNIGIDVAAGQITGTATTQQYSVDGGTTWHDATATNTAVTFAGGNSVVVREKATASAFASASTIPINVAAPATAPNGSGINVAVGQITGTTATQQYSLDGGTTWNDATAGNTTVTFAGGNSVVVREKATASALASASTTPINVAAPATAPTSIGINVVAGQITGTTATQQYSVNGGTTWNDATAGNTAVTFAGGNSIVVREKATASALASDSTTPILLQAPASAPTANKAQGTDGGTINLTGLTNGVTYEYVVDSNATLAGDAAGWSGATSVTLSSTDIDNIAVDAGQYVHIRVKATATNFASNVQDVAQITIGDINPTTALGVTVGDALGASNDGKGTITTPVLPVGATGFKYQVNATVPTVTGGQSTSTGWTALTASATSAPIALTNGQVVTVAIVDASDNVIAIQNITVSGIADYIAGTSAVKTGTANVGQNGSFNAGDVPFTLNGIVIPLTNLHGPGATANATSVAEALQADIEAVFTGTANVTNGSSIQTFTVTTSGNVLVITAPSISGVPQVALTGSNANLLQFLGLTANTNNGTNGSN